MKSEKLLCDTPSGIKPVEYIVDSPIGKLYVYKRDSKEYGTVMEKDVCPYFEKGSIIETKDSKRILVTEINYKSVSGISIFGEELVIKCNEIKEVLSYNKEKFLNSIFANTVHVIGENGTLVELEEGVKYLYIKGFAAKILVFTFTKDDILDQDGNVIKLSMFEESDLFKPLSDVF